MEREMQTGSVQIQLAGFRYTLAIFTDSSLCSVFISGEGECSREECDVRAK